MPYDREFASYAPLRRIVTSAAVTDLVSRARRIPDAQRLARPTTSPPPQIGTGPSQPAWVLAIDGSWAEVKADTGYPEAFVGYNTVASVLLNRGKLKELDANRPIDPVQFRPLEQEATVDAALPGSNVSVGSNRSAHESFRESLFTILKSVTPSDSTDKETLLGTYEALLDHKPRVRPQRCPVAEFDCDERMHISAGQHECPCPHKAWLYSTDALRIGERFRTLGTNGEAFGLVMSVWEHVLLIHLLRRMESESLLDQTQKIAFILDGPLAIFGPPAWLSAAISTELKRLNGIVRELTGHDLLLFGVEKSGAFVDHFDELDGRDASGTELFPRGHCFLPDDQYIRERINFSAGGKRYGADTYYGRKMLYKTVNGARIVVNIPFLRDSHDNLDDQDLSSYPQIAAMCPLLDDLVSSRYPDAVSPIVAAHAHAAIPLRLGGDVLQQLTTALMAS